MASENVAPESGVETILIDSPVLYSPFFKDKPVLVERISWLQTQMRLMHRCQTVVVDVESFKSVVGWLHRKFHLLRHCLPAGALPEEPARLLENFANDAHNACEEFSEVVKHEQIQQLNMNQDVRLSAYTGDLGEVTKMLTLFPHWLNHDVHNPDEFLDDIPVLFYAVLGGQVDCVEWLLSRPGICVNSLRRKTTNDLVDLLDGEDDYCWGKVWGTPPLCTPLSLAVEKGDVACCQRLLENGADTWPAAYYDALRDERHSCNPSFLQLECACTVFDIAERAHRLSGLDDKPRRMAIMNAIAYATQWQMRRAEALFDAFDSGCCGRLGRADIKALAVAAGKWCGRCEEEWNDPEGGPYCCHSKCSCCFAPLWQHDGYLCSGEIWIDFLDLADDRGGLTKADFILGYREYANCEVCDTVGPVHSLSDAYERVVLSPYHRYWCRAIMQAHDPASSHPLLSFFASWPQHKRAIGALVVKYLNGLGGQSRVSIDKDLEACQAEVDRLETNIASPNWRTYFHSALNVIKTRLQLSPQSPRSHELWELHSHIRQLADTRSAFLLAVQNGDLETISDRVASEPQYLNVHAHGFEFHPEAVEYKYTGLTPKMAISSCHSVAEWCCYYEHVHCLRWFIAQGDVMINPPLGKTSIMLYCLEGKFHDRPSPHAIMSRHSELLTLTRTQTLVSLDTTGAQACAVSTTSCSATSCPSAI